MLWVMGALPFVLLILGFPIFLILLATCAVALTFFSSVPPTIAASDHVRHGQQVRLVGRAVLHIRR